MGWLAMEPDPGQIEAARRQVMTHRGLDYIGDPARASWECGKCSLSLWGSGDGRGQACKTLRRLLVLVDGWTMPALLTLPPTSVKTFDQYASAQASRGGAYFSIRTRFEVEQKRNPAGVTFSAIKLTAAGDLDDDDLAAVLALRAQYAELVRSMEIAGDEYDLP